MGTHPIFESDFDCLTEPSNPDMTNQEEVPWLRNSILTSGASNLIFNEKIKRLRAEGETIHHLGFGQCPFPIPDAAIAECQRQSWKSTYCPTNGIVELRQSIVNFHKKVDGIHHFDESDVIVGPGSKELIYLTMNALEGYVILLSPAWPSYLPQAKLASKKTLIIHRTIENKWKLTAEQLSQELAKNPVPKKSLLIFTNPDNPTGAVYTEEELKKLASVCKEHDLIVLSDEIYGLVKFNNENNISIAKYYPEATLLVSGISKWCGGGGWRMGYVFYPKELKPLYSAVMSCAGQTYATVAEPIQWACVKLFDFTPDIVDYNRHCRRILAAVAKFAFEELNKCGVKVTPASATFYLFPNFECCRQKLLDAGKHTGQDFCDMLFDEQKVALMPGGPSFLRPIDELTTRLCFNDFNGKDALVASKAIGLDKELPTDFVKLHASTMHNAIQKLVVFVNKYKQ